jgi:transcriptional regulator with XRE-family HTH domain
MPNFGEKLRTLRERRDMTQRMLASELGFSQAYVYKLENGQRRPSGELVFKVSQIFNISADVLLNDALELPET